MTSAPGQPGRDDAAEPAPDGLGEAIRTGRVPVVPGSLVDLVMQSGSGSGPATAADPATERDPGDRTPAPEPPAAEPPAAAPRRPAPRTGRVTPGPGPEPGRTGFTDLVTRGGPGARPAPAAEEAPEESGTPAATGEPATSGFGPGDGSYADLGDLGDDPLGVGPLPDEDPLHMPADRFAPPPSFAPDPSDPPAPAASVRAGDPDGPQPVADQPPATPAGGRPRMGGVRTGTDGVPVTAPAPTVVPPISPTPRPLDEATAATPAVPATDTAAPATATQPASATRSKQWPPRSSRPAPDGPETDILPPGALIGHYPSAPSESSRPADPAPGPATGPRPTMPGRRSGPSGADRSVADRTGTDRTDRPAAEDAVSPGPAMTAMSGNDLFATQGGEIAGGGFGRLPGRDSDEPVRGVARTPQDDATPAETTREERYPSLDGPRPGPGSAPAPNGRTSSAPHTGALPVHGDGPAGRTGSRADRNGGRTAPDRDAPGSGPHAAPDADDHGTGRFVARDTRTGTFAATDGRTTTGPQTGTFAARDGRTATGPQTGAFPAPDGRTGSRTGAFPAGDGRTGAVPPRDGRGAAGQHTGALPAYDAGTGPESRTAAVPARDGRTGSTPLPGADVPADRRADPGTDRPSRGPADHRADGGPEGTQHAPAPRQAPRRAAPGGAASAAGSTETMPALDADGRPRSPQQPGPGPTVGRDRTAETAALRPTGEHPVPGAAAGRAGGPDQADADAAVPQAAAAASLGAVSVAAKRAATGKDGTVSETGPQPVTPESKPISPRREAIMSAAPRNGRRGVSPAGLAIGLAILLLGGLTLWAMLSPTPQNGGAEPAPAAVGAAEPGLGPRAAALPVGASDPRPQVRGTIPAGAAPVAVAATPGGSALVAVQDANRLLVLDPAGDAVTGEIPLPAAPQTVTTSPDGARAFVGMAGPEGGQIAVVDVPGGTVLNTVPVAADPAGAVPSADGRFLYVPSRADGAVAEVDPYAGVVTRSAPVSGTPDAIVADDAADRLFLAVGGSNELTVLDPNSLTVLGTFPIGGEAGAVATTRASAPEPLVAVGGPESDTVTVLNPVDGREISRFDAAGGPTGLAFAGDGRHLYVVSDQGLQVVDTGTWRETGTADVAVDPTAVTVSADGRTGWITGNGEVSVLDLA
ncbi:YncE family protein [Pseudonocardia sp. HH130630-07]|uniref:YncE family protein n=1 Tax=Pseudonocardia sp. HH130630-07 TaxID=1690815 RepID=UPI000814CA69|nr:YncE family protein [Pseudonocardia sp. HH130630-07]ANY08145.1 hypothetical protein AFB00_19735 [Pseudonocardia sp. HH130630-07]